MDTIVLDTIPFAAESEALLRTLKVRDDTPQAAEVRTLLAEARPIARPKAVYGVAPVESRVPDSVVVDGVTFTSRVLRVNLEQANRVFPFVATCGRELDAWSDSIGGMLRRFFADAIKEAALESAILFSKRHLEETFQPGPTGMMNPGSLKDWPTSEQKNLFALLGGSAEAIGVHLTESCIMSPIKSVSGILFPTAAEFESCRLCPILKCPRRRAPYDEGLFESKYRK